MWTKSLCDNSTTTIYINEPYIISDVTHTKPEPENDLQLLLKYMSQSKKEHYSFWTWSIHFQSLQMAWPVKTFQFTELEK